ncbi:MAG: DNA mismatch repair endonuclease MutL [Proteobacteria bacterium]|nr:DNA mismatch repair endonuclease MutL [Pseudomonadota bacterium]MBU1736595.1 DNA mismatch repair endonuclease MutL [Pseudomonadota bacterium]
MSRIRILPENLANQIAAGEVVERPASVVKELLENSLDAGARNISIQVEGGGTSLLRVIDDGGGMDQDDVLLCLERHATSKISSVEELDQIKTLGFRGEAVPSIASVSRMSITSRPVDFPLGCKVEVRFGKVVKVHEMGCQRGTVVEVRDLFGNVPARKKFLKTTRTELAHIDEVVKNYGLVSPECSLKYAVNGREILALPGVGKSGVVSRIRLLLGLGGEEVLLDLAAADAGTELKVSGFLLPPDQPHGPAARLRAFVNGRPVRDRLITHAVAEGMRNFLMIGRQPAGVISLDLPANVIDVNVHPTKQEVRFHKSGQVHQAIVSAVGQALLNYQSGIRTALFGGGRSPVQGGIGATAEKERLFPDRHVARDAAAFPRESAAPRETKIEKTVPASLFSEPVVRYDVQVGETSAARLGSPPDGSTGTEGHEPERRAAGTEAEKRMGQLRVIGQLFDSYILCEGKDGLVAIDQHAAQERLIFERLKNQLAAGRLASQRLMFPKTMELAAEEIGVIEEEGGELARLGLELQEFGGSTYVLKAIPAIMSHLPPEEVFFSVMRQLADDGTARGGRASLDHLLAGMACKAAIKANHSLLLPELESLLGEMEKNDVFSHCPHGRPVVRFFSADEIRKWFHRT